MYNIRLSSRNKRGSRAVCTNVIQDVSSSVDVRCFSCSRNGRCWRVRCTKADEEHAQIYGECGFGKIGTFIEYGSIFIKIG